MPFFSLCGDFHCFIALGPEFVAVFLKLMVSAAFALCKQQQMLKTMSSPSLLDKYRFMSHAPPHKRKAHVLARKIRQELLLRGVHLADEDDESTVHEWGICDRGTCGFETPCLRMPCNVSEK